VIESWFYLRESVATSITELAESVATSITELAESVATSVTELAESVATSITRRLHTRVRFRADVGGSILDQPRVGGVGATVAVSVPSRNPHTAARVARVTMVSALNRPQL